MVAPGTRRNSPAAGRSRAAAGMIVVIFPIALIVTIPYRCVLRLLVMGVKIAVIGGGIGGLTAAIALARPGMAVGDYEQAPALEEGGAGVGLWPNPRGAWGLIGLSVPGA